jgi:hypothetical protein
MPRRSVMRCLMRSARLRFPRKNPAPPPTSTNDLPRTIIGLQNTALSAGNTNPSRWPHSAVLKKVRAATDGGDEQIFGAE